MATRQEQINATLERLANALGADMTGAVAVSADGILLAARMSNDINADRVGAVAATMIGVTRRVSGELRIGATEETIIKADNGLFVVVPAGNEALLAVSLRQGANLGLVRIELRESGEAVRDVLSARA
jgi:uncharacterized protein